MREIKPQEIESVIKAKQNAHLLSSDLINVASSENGLLSDAALDLLKVVSEVERKLERLVLALGEEDLSMPNQSLAEKSYAAKREDILNP